MKAVEFIKYLAGADFIQRMFETERQLKVKSTGRSDVLPTDCDLETSVRIYGLRAAAIVKYPIILISRATGMDYVHQRLRTR